MRPAEHRLLELAGEAIELPAGERDRFLEELKTSDPELLPRLRNLLHEHETGPSILDDPEALTLVLEGEPPDLGLLRAGTVLVERFEILGLLGTGGMGAAYSAWDRELQTRVALKVLTADSADHPAESRFRREVQLARQITHPNVCRVHDLFWHRDEAGDTAFLTMELVDGPTLAQYLRERGRLSPSDALPLARQIASALDAAHQAGVIHRDLKPSNIMLQAGPESRRIVVTDFGLARESDPEHKRAAFVTATGNIAGTPAYMAPEQLLGEVATARTDVYAFGLVLYEMITGALPFDADSPLSMAMKRLKEAPLSPRESLPDLDARWERAILKSLERDPARRFESAGALVSALEPGKRSFTRPVPRSTVAALGIVLAIVLGILLRKEPVPPAAVPAPPGERSARARTNPRWVLVTSFDNGTGDALLDGTLEFALARELERSSSISVVSQDRVDDTLRLMRRSPGGALDRSLGREVAVRDGAIKDVVAGKVLRVGSTLLLSVDLLDPRDGATIASWDEEARSMDDVLPAIRRIGSRIRAKIGPGGSVPPDERLAQVTTSSLRALQLYTAADRIVAVPLRAEEAEELLRQAVAEDPEFASGYIHLAYAIKNRGGAPREYLPSVDRAVEESGRAGERERLFIRASAFRLRGEFDKAEQVYRALLSRYPDYSWALNNMVSILSRYTPRWAEAVEYSVRLAEARPNDPAQVLLAARAIATWSDEPARAKPLVDRGRSLLQGQRERFVYLASWLEQYDLQQLWMSGRLEDLHEGFGELRDRAASSRGWASELDTRVAGNVALALGRPEEAMEVYSHLPRDEREAYRLLTSSFQGDGARTHRILVDLSAHPEGADRLWLIAQCARMGEVDRAKRLYAGEVENLEGMAVDDRRIHQTMLEAVHALILGRSGKPEEALPRLEKGMADLRPTGGYLYFILASERARVLAAGGEGAAAVEVLDEASAQRYRTVEGLARSYWMEMRAQLGTLQRRLGHPDAADEIEREIEALTRLREPDFSLRAGSG